MPSGYIDVGEDGSPFASGNFLMVTDGLGGRGGFFHTRFRNNDILDSAKFYDIAVSPVLNDSDAEFRGYVENSFRELFMLKDVYFTGRPYENKRTSGYFASRLVSAIVLNTFKFNPDFDKEELFSKVLSCETEEQRTAVLNEYGAALSQIIKTGLHEMAENIGLEMESKIRGSYLLPTTLNVAVLHEQEDFVDVVYFWAGDSRAYLWNEDGLAQITEDHEDGETMTNLISLTKDFYIDTKYMRFDKPCIVFNTTDGCYKPNCFASPLDFEYVFLDSFREADNPESYSQLLFNKYREIGSDDSDTMALAVFGYDDFQEIRDAVERRFAVIDTEIRARLPEIFERDYRFELEQAEAQARREQEEQDRQVFSLGPAKQFCIRKMVQSNWPLYEEEIRKINAEDSELLRKISDVRQGVVTWISNHWLNPPCLRKLSLIMDGKGKNPYEYYNQLSEKANDYRLLLNERKEYWERELPKLVDSIKTSIRLAFEVDRSTGDKESLMETIEPLTQFIGEMKRAEKKLFGSSLMPTYKDKLLEIVDLNNRYAKEEISSVEKTADDLIQFGPEIFDGKGIDFGPDSEVGLLLEKINRCKSALGESQARKDEIKERIAERYIRSEGNKLMEEILNQPGLVPEDIKNDFLKKNSELKGKITELERCLEVRQTLYDVYEKNYLRFLRGGNNDR